MRGDRSSGLMLDNGSRAMESSSPCARANANKEGRRVCKGLFFGYELFSHSGDSDFKASPFQLRGCDNLLKYQTLTTTDIILHMLRAPDTF
eukprot:3064676-Amphidinium_carterae.1